MTKRFWAKLLGWIGTIAAAAGEYKLAGKWSPLLTVGGLGLMGSGVHIGSNTSAGHPDGDKTK